MKKIKQSKNTEIKSTKNKAGISSALIFIVIIISIVSGAAFALKDKHDASTVETINSEYVNLNAKSDAWSCPYLVSGDTDNSNALIIYNPSDVVSNVIVKIYNIKGELINEKDVEIKPKARISESIFSYGANLNASAIVESFGSPIVVYRSLLLSDGQEIIPCVKTPSSIIELDNLVTKRNTNSYLYLNNPHNVSVVVDIKAKLVDTSMDPFGIVLDDSRGIVIGAFGRADVDLQAMFGRYSLLNITVVSRSGFISGEALVDYKDGYVTNGQTIVTSSYSENMSDTSYLFTKSPANIFAQSNTLASSILNVASIGTENRLINSEEQTLGAGATSSIVDLGTEFGFHVVKTKVKHNKAKKTKSDTERVDEIIKSNKPFISIVSSYLTNEIVSASASTSSKSKNVILAAKDSDTVAIYNTSKNKSKVSISFIGDTKEPQKNIEIDGNSLITFSLNDTETSPNIVILSIDSTQEIVVAGTRIGFSGVTNGVYVKK